MVRPTAAQGKVRDTYVVGDKIVIVSTDRQSAFDRVLAAIPFKVLAAFGGTFAASCCGQCYLAGCTRIGCAAYGVAQGRNTFLSHLVMTSCDPWNRRAGASAEPNQRLVDATHAAHCAQCAAGSSRPQCCHHGALRCIPCGICCSWLYDRRVPFQLQGKCYGTWPAIGL